MAADDTSIPNLGQQKVRFLNDGGHVCGMGFKISDVERPPDSGVTIGGSRKPSNIQGTRW